MNRVLQINGLSARRSVIPIPPFEMRQLVGPTDEASFDNPSGRPVFDGLPPGADDMVVDFGCGCGRIARRLIQQMRRPKKYVGFDMHKGMVAWCNTNLAPLDANFSFLHHDIYNRGFNPDPGLPAFAPMPVGDASASFLIAWSVFTHTTQQQTEFYIREVSRVLRPDGLMLATFFMFEKAYFPMMQDNQNTLYINDTDPTNATIFDRTWLQELLRGAGLGIRKVSPPAIRGFHWLLEVGHVSQDDTSLELPIDRSPFGRSPPPVPRSDPSKIA